MKIYGGKSNGYKLLAEFFTLINVQQVKLQFQAKGHEHFHVKYQLFLTLTKAATC
jgi:hypothetical protein